MNLAYANVGPEPWVNIVIFVSYLMFMFGTVLCGYQLAALPVPWGWKAVGLFCGLAVLFISTYIMLAAGIKQGYVEFVGDSNWTRKLLLIAYVVGPVLAVARAIQRGHRRQAQQRGVEPTI